MSNALTHLDQPSDLAHAAIRYKEAFIEVSHRAAQAAIARENMQLANCDAYEAFNADRQANFDADEEPPVSMGFTGQLSDQLGKDQKVMGKEAFQAKLRSDQCKAAMQRAEFNVDSSRRSLEEAEQDLLSEARVYKA